MNKIFKLSAVVLSLTFAQFRAAGQLSKIQDTKIGRTYLSVYQTLLKDDDKLIFPDSSSLTVFNFKLLIEKSTDNKVRVTSIFPSEDKLGLLLPNYKKLSDINFSPLIGSDSRICLIVPIIFSTQKKNKPVGDQEAVISLAEAFELLRAYQMNPDFDAAIQKFKDGNNIKKLITQPIVFNRSSPIK
ncbi:hypothetical protein C7T94_03820 [Pedobacter yulinensis]|uniref:Uncharacterized protein n=1 Tax=Pedobacter yulinensis TaxID=2126353 RepID=A0A2T3HS62_9SPHI|nr:hypothetical protein [Pedobacter yulinensis]PST85241.1 hypothetical protein C7T94_03820 [Pedobacter yulinensis]